MQFSYLVPLIGPCQGRPEDFENRVDKKIFSVLYCEVVLDRIDVPVEMGAQFTKP